MGQLLQSVKNKNKYKLPITLCYANAESLPFKDNSFDVVYHIDVYKRQAPQFSKR